MFPSDVHSAFTFLWFDDGVSERWDNQSADVTPPDVLVDRIADRIRSWSHTESDVALGLASIRSRPAPGRRLIPATPASVVEAFAHSPTTAVGLLTADDRPVLDDGQWEPVAIDAEPATPAAPPLDTALGSEWIAASDPIGAPVTLLSTGPFDDLLVAMMAPPKKALVPTGPLPPPERFRVRVARVTKSDRSTKRDYDYFEELEASLEQLKHRSSAPDA